MGKKLYVLLVAMVLAFAARRLDAQAGQTIYVNGTRIQGLCGDTLLLRGINYAPHNWGWSPGQIFMDQIALTGANCVRIPWYKLTPDGATPQATYNNLVYLDSAISQCVRYNMIPILELHDQTCNDNPAALSTLAAWYVQPAVLTLITKYKHSLILNVANEALYVNWSGNVPAARNTYTATYSAIVSNLRSNGITVPVMIDGPDCGASLDVLADAGPALQAADPAHNLIFSAHAYWYAYANNDSTQMAARINYALSKNIPFVLGEIANTQDENGVYCKYTLNYKPLMRICQQKNLHWIAWSWDNDGCAIRQVSSTGSFANLTAYGTDIVNNPQYGLLTHAPAKSRYLTTGCTTTGLSEQAVPPQFSIYPNPSAGEFTISSDKAIGTVQAFDLLGREMALLKTNTTSYHFKDALKGVYLIRATMADGRQSLQRLLIKD